MSILDYIRPNIFNNPIANSQGMYNPDKKENMDNVSALQKYKLAKQQDTLSYHPELSFNSFGMPQLDATKEFTGSASTMTDFTNSPSKQYNPPSIQNGKLIAGTPMEGSSPPLQSQVANAFDGVAQMNLDNQQLQNINDPFSSQALKQLPQQEIAQKLFANPQVEQSKTNILGEQVTSDVTKSTGVKGVSSYTDPVTNIITYGNTGFIPNKEGTILNNGAEGRTTINGKVDKNSEFYKRNKKAMENL